MDRYDIYWFFSPFGIGSGDGSGYGSGDGMEFNYIDGILIVGSTPGIGFSSDGLSLWIPVLRFDNEGVYKMRVDNQAGSDHGIAIVTIQGKHDGF